MSTRILSHDTGHEIGIKVYSHGWYAVYNDKPTPLAEIPQRFHEMIRNAVKEVCKVNNWSDLSEL